MNVTTEQLGHMARLIRLGYTPSQVAMQMTRADYEFERWYDLAVLIAKRGR